MFLNMTGVTRGKGEDTSFRLESLPRIVITLVQPISTSSSLSCTKGTKRKLSSPIKPVKCMREDAECLNTTRLRGKGSYIPIRLEHLPTLVLCHLMQYLPHSALLNLSLTNSSLHSLVMKEWKGNSSLWRHITISHDLSPSRILSLKKALAGKKRFVRSIR